MLKETKKQYEKETNLIGMVTELDLFNFSYDQLAGKKPFRDKDGNTIDSNIYFALLLLEKRELARYEKEYENKKAIFLLDNSDEELEQAELPFEFEIEITKQAIDFLSKKIVGVTPQNKRRVACIVPLLCNNAKAFSVTEENGYTKDIKKDMVYFANNIHRYLNLYLKHKGTETELQHWQKLRDNVQLFASVVCGAGYVKISSTNIEKYLTTLTKSTVVNNGVQVSGMTPAQVNTKLLLLIGSQLNGKGVAVAKTNKKIEEMIVKYENDKNEK